MIRQPVRKLAFIHVPKTGGTSIRAALERDWPLHVDGGYRTNAIWRLHQTAFDAQLRTPDWREHFSFAVVRNPWDRMVSMWGGGDPSSFPEFLRAATQQGGPMHHFMQPQTAYVFGPDGQQAVTRLLRFENLEAEFAGIAKQWGGGPLEHLNAGTHKPYRDYYDHGTKLLVGRMYRSDVEAFAYPF